MEIILLQTVKGLGEKSEVKNVSPGYARNFLFPNKLAVAATPEKLKILNLEKELALEKRKKIVSQLREMAERIKETAFVFKLKAGEKNKPFGSVSAKDIETALKEKQFGKTKINLPKPLKSFGEHKVEIDFGEGVKTEIKIILSPLL